MAFIRDGTKLAQYSSNFGLRIWDITHLTDEHWHSVHEYEFMPCDMTDGWVVGRDNEPVLGPSRAQGESIRATAWSGTWDTRKEGNGRGPL